MKTLAEIARIQQVNSPTYFDDPRADRALALLLMTAEEVCVLRDRLETAASLVADGKLPTDPSIDDYVVSEEQMAQRLVRHRAYFTELFTQLGEPSSEG